MSAHTLMLALVGVLLTLAAVVAVGAWVIHRLLRWTAADDEAYRDYVDGYHIGRQLRAELGMDDLYHEDVHRDGES